SSPRQVLRTCRVSRRSTGILGNEACDLDSVVATLVYGYYLYSVRGSDASTLFLPILNIPREQFRLRTETTHFLSKVNLSLDLLTFRDEVDLLNLHNEGKLLLSLVDHNVLPAKDAILENTVVTVIDHRPQERPDSERTEVILDLVGSCCTLVTEQLLQHPFFDMDDQIATLLYGTILIDTVNRSPEAGKTTSRDDEILDELARKLPDVSAKELFDELQEAKCNISGLSNEEILLKDLKKIGNTNMTIAMCSVSRDLQGFTGMGKYKHDHCHVFCEQGFTGMGKYKHDHCHVFCEQGFTGMGKYKHDHCHVFCEQGFTGIYRDLQVRGNTNMTIAMCSLSMDLPVWGNTDMTVAMCSVSMDLPVWGNTDMTIAMCSVSMDLQVWGNTNMTIAMCSVSRDLQTLLDRDGFVDDLKSFCAAQGAEVAVLMTLSSSGSSVQRQLAVYSENRIFRQQIADLLDTSSSPSLQLEPQPSPSESLMCFSQGNVKGSRKKVIPILKSFLTGEETPGMDVSGFPFEGLESGTIGSDVPLTNIKDSFSQEVPEDFPQDTSDDPFGLFSGGGEASSENQFSSSNPFADDFLSSSNSNANQSPWQHQASDEFDPFSLASLESNSDDKKESGRNQMDSFIDSLLSGSNSGVDPPQSAEGMNSAKVEATSDLESSLELSTEVKSAGSSYPVTPPNSFLESDMERFAKEHNLPSFNNSEMVKIIKDRQASLDKDVIPEEQGEESDLFPYTPRNSYQESPLESLDRHHELPSFQSDEMLQRIMDKRASLGGEVNERDSMSNRSSSDRSFPEEEAAQQIKNTAAFAITQDIKGSNPFGMAEIGQDGGADNMVAQSLAQEMTDADPFSLGIQQTQGFLQNSGKACDDDPFRLGLMSNADTNVSETSAGDTTDSDPFWLAPANQENVLAASIAEEMKSSNPFSIGNEADTGESDTPEQPTGVVRERSVENFQDFLPEVERNVISPDRSPKHRALSDGAASGQQEAAKLDEIFGYGDLDSNLKRNLYQHNKEAMAEDIIRQNLEEAQRKASDQMAGIVMQQSSVDKFSEEMKKPVFGAVEVEEDHGSLMEDNIVASNIALEMKPSGQDEEEVENQSFGYHEESENVVASSIAAEISSEDVMSNDNVVAASIAAEMKSSSSEDVMSNDNVVAASIAAEMKSSSSEDVMSSDNVVAASIAAEMKSSSSDVMSNDNVVADMHSDQQKEKAKNTFSRMDSQYLLENENMMAGLIANDMETELFSDKDREGIYDEKKNSKGVKFSESLSSSSDSENFDAPDKSSSLGFETDGGKSEELAVAQKFAEEIISEACEIVAKDEKSASESAKGTASKGLSRREMALKMMEADEFDSEEESDKEEGDVEPGNSEEERDDSVVEDDIEKEDEGSKNEKLDEANTPEEPAESDQDKPNRLQEHTDHGQLEGGQPEEGPESDVSIARRITDTVLSEALGHVSKEAEDSAIAEKLAEAMRESNSEEDSDELDKKVKRTRFGDECSVTDADNNVNNSESVDNEEPEILTRESHWKGHMDNEWDSMDEFKKDNEIVEDNGNKEDNGINTSNTRSDTKDLSPDSEEAVREVAFDMAADIIQKALDTFPVEEMVEEPEESLSSSPSSDISPNSENYPLAEGHTEMKRSHEMCPIALKDDKTNQELALPLETEYLPNVDPLRGSLDLVTSPVQKLETDASKEVAEDTSFKQLSTEIYSSHSDEESEESVIEDLTASKGSSLGTSASEGKESVISSQTGKDKLTEKTQAPLMSSEHSNLSEVSSQSTSQSEQDSGESLRTEAAAGIEMVHASRTTESASSKQELQQDEPSLLDGKKRKEVYMTTAGRISISTDYQAESDDDHQMALTEVTIAEESRHQVGEILARAESVVGHADAELACSADTAQQDDVTDEEFLYKKTTRDLAEAIADTDSSEFQHETAQDSVESRVVPIETEVRLRQDSESSDTFSRSARPTTLSLPPASPALQTKRKIHPNIDLMAGEGSDSDTSPGGDDDSSLSSVDTEPLDDIDDLETPDITTPDAFGMAPELEWENDTPVVSPAAEAIPEYTAEEESDDQKNWRKVTIGDQQFTIDMKVVEPYKRVLSHGGYYGEGLNAMIVFSGCYLPDRSRKDYSYVMENLFFYVISTLELLVAEDYMIVYFHGATPRRQMPSFSWLKRCYQMIDRRLKKNLKGLLLVHPTLWIKTIIMMSRPFISSKFSSKLKIVKTLAELETLVPMEYVFVPDQVKEVDKVAMLNPTALEKGFDSPDDLSTAAASPVNLSSSGKKKTKARFWKRKK
ncbi:protein prune homolog 2-like, partial [Liolophura sinensis]|uniref:protein prune homolog 2-like n=1 Tax=Liolophura sinensis TaxID=3198878 RepID=UPI0031582044